jgi:hypothetical protein
MPKPKMMLAPCGLDCSVCLIRKLPFDSTAAKNVIAWYKEQGWLRPEEGVKDAVARRMYCKGCRGDRTDVHWSADCVILACCIDEKRHEFCYQCSAFPCQRLQDWAKESGHHREALANLQAIKEGKKPVSVDLT